AIALASDRPGEGVPGPASITFTPADWNVPQTVTVTGADDAIDDGDVAYHIVTGPAASADPAYAGLDADDVALVNADDDAAGISASALVTSEPGTSARFTIRLASQPIADVIVPVISSNPAEGTPSPAQVTITAADWNVPHTVTVTGVDDFVADGDVAYTVHAG